ncbi:profilin, required for normal timing of actin polymerization in response to thermal stress, partial [Linderina pennispora]
LSPEEFQNIKAGFDDAGVLQANGIRAAGTKYLALQVDSTHVHGKKGADGVLIDKTNQTIIVAVYDENTQPGEANKVLGSVSDYLRGIGY